MSTIAAGDFQEEPNASVSALLSANLTKMHHQQQTCQWVRAWSFALVAFFFGSTYLVPKTPLGSALVFVLAEFVLLFVLLKDVQWHAAFWQYRDRARACESHLLRNLSFDDFCKQYAAAKLPSRLDLVKGAFSLPQFVTLSNDFIETYLMAVVLVAFLIRLITFAFPNALAHL